MTQAPPPRNLPFQLTSFVGRESAMAELIRLLHDHRLVTITGTAGLGKTRLALQVASRVLAEHPGGVWFVSLGAVADPALVPGEVATGLGMREPLDGSALETLAERLGANGALLVLDNCEHVLAAAARLVEAMLSAAPGLRVLATTHEPLRVPGERVWRIDPLGLPDSAAEPALQALAGCEAVQLFEARACLVRPQFTLSPANLAVAAQICRRLDGIPLAIELAAARTEMMSVEDILERLDDRFRLLTGGSRTSMPRHRTLRAALDWAHHLLNADEQKLFRRLSVFPAGFELPAVEAICADAELPAQEILGHLLRLVDKSLVMTEAGAGHTRYRMLETVRLYGAERLLDSGKGDEVRRRHLDHFASLAEAAAAYERRPGQAEWLERLEGAHDDLRAALRWARVHDSPRWVRLATSLGWFWLTRGHYGEGRELLQEVLRLPTLDGLDRARALFQLARLASWQGDYGIGREMAAQSLAIYRELGEDVQAGWALNLLGVICTYAGDDAEGRARLEESVAIAADDFVRIEALMALGELALQSGDPERARRFLEKGLALASGRDARWHVATGVLFLAVTEYFSGNHARCRELAAESLDVFQQLGNRYALSGALDVFGALALAGREPARALRICAAAAAIRDAVRAPLAPRWRGMVCTVVIEPARLAVGSGAEIVWADGARMTPQEAVTCALAQAGPGVGPAGSEGPPAGGPLSPREHQVAILVAQGLTNKQIADRLGIAERTAEGHLERIRGKLGLHSRTQIAVWVVERARTPGRP